MKILVLDSDKVLCATLQRVLAARQLEVHSTSSAPEAIEMLQDNDYALVLMDYFLPPHDGLWFMHHAALPRTTKVLLMIGQVNRSVITAMFDLGTCGYMIKPFDEEDLMHNLNFFLSLRINGILDSKPGER